MLRAGCSGREVRLLRDCTYRPATGQGLKRIQASFPHMPADVMPSLLKFKETP